MAKVQTGAKQPLSLTRQQVSEQQAMGQKQREADKMSPQEKKKLNQQAEKNQTKEELEEIGQWIFQADKKTGEMYAIAQKNGNLSSLSKGVYGSESAYTKLATINNIKNPDQIRVHQRVKLEYFEGYNNDRYKLLMKKSFLMGELSFRNLYNNNVTAADFTKTEEGVVRQHILDLELLYEQKKVTEKQYKIEIDRIGGYFYEGAVGNCIAFTTELSKKMETYASWKNGWGMKFTHTDKTLLGILNVNVISGDLGIKWSLPGVSYDGNEIGKNNIGISAKMDLTLASISHDIPLPGVPVKAVIGGKLGGGIGFEAGKTPGSKKILGFSAAFGLGMELSIEMK